MDAAVQKNISRSWLKEIITSCTIWEKYGKDSNQNDVQIVDRSYLQKNFKAQSETAQI